MGEFNMIPGSGMDSRADVKITFGEESKKFLSSRFTMKPSGALSEFTYRTRKRFREEKEYIMLLKVDLNPFFGTLTTTDNMVLR